MMIPQIRSTLATVLVILIGVPLFTVFQLNALGEITGWAGAWTVIQHTFFNTCMIAVGWIFFRSPFAGKLTEIVQSVTATSPSGAVRQTDTKVTVQEPDTAAIKGGGTSGVVTTTVNTGIGPPVTVETEQKK